MMVNTLQLLLVLSLLSVVTVLVVGVVTFMYGGVVNQLNSLRLMNARVIIQGISLLLLAVILLLKS